MRWINGGALWAATIAALGTVVVAAMPASVAADPAFEAQAVTIINEFRPRKGRPALAVHPRLTELARQHSQRMASTNRMNHDGYHARMRQSGFGLCYENVGWNYQTPQSLVQGWMNSASHHSNLLQPNIRYVGLAKVGSYVTFFACG